jgi:hypothetical protein
LIQVGHLYRHVESNEVLVGFGSAYLAAVGWPMVEQKSGGTTFYRFDLAQNTLPKRMINYGLQQAAAFKATHTHSTEPAPFESNLVQILLSTVDCSYLW